MSREIKFRARRKLNGDWVYGSYLKGVSEDWCYVFETGGDPSESGDAPIIRVITKTVGQFTGLHDKHGKEIYEGDICDAWVSRWPDKRTRGIVVWNNDCGAFQLQYEGAFGNQPTDFIHRWHYFEIIGNIYQHPHLLNQ